MLIMIQLLRVEELPVLANRDISHRFMTSGKPIPSQSSCSPLTERGR